MPKSRRLYLCFLQTWRVTLWGKDNNSGLIQTVQANSIWTRSNSALVKRANGVEKNPKGECVFIVFVYLWHCPQCRLYKCKAVVLFSFCPHLVRQRRMVGACTRQAHILYLTITLFFIETLAVIWSRAFVLHNVQMKTYIVVMRWWEI